MNFQIISLFPEMFEILKQGGIVKRASDKNIIQLSLINPRDYTDNVHRNIDDRPYGGGPGMVMMVEPLRKAIHAAKQKNKGIRTIYLSPQGKPLTQTHLQTLLQYEQLTLIAGRYEGIDERIIEQDIDEEISIGDYVLSGGELAAMVLIDAITRLLPDSLGDQQSAEQDSFTAGLLDCPHYTRPETIDNQAVPTVLLSGNHQAIAAWRRQQALGATWKKRPDLLAKLELSDSDKALLEAYKKG